MKEKTLKIIIAVLAVLLVAGVTAYAATNYGSKDDPLITKSYLDEVVIPQMAEEFQKKLDAAAAEIVRSAPGEFTKVDLKSGQTLYCSTGSELLPVFGTLSAVGTMADTTAGGAVSTGSALVENGGGASASSTAAVLICGSYRIE